MRTLCIALVTASLALGCSKQEKKAERTANGPAATPVAPEADGKRKPPVVDAPGAAKAKPSAIALPSTPIVNPTVLHPPDSAVNGAVGLLRKAKFAEARKLADAVLKKDPRDRNAYVVVAFTRYIEIVEQLRMAMAKNIQSADKVGQFAHAAMRKAYVTADQQMSSIMRDLSFAANSKNFAFDLCLACWEYDWNGNGRVDDRDRKLLQLEVDHNGKDIAENDPRRKPVYRFDLGDIYWAHAMVNFQAGLLNLVLAYDWGELDKLIAQFAKPPPDFTIKLANKTRLISARTRFRVALTFAATTRRAYLAETDDEREWVPNPKQQNHPIPFPISEQLFETWGGVIGDLQNILDGKEGISLGELSHMLPKLKVRPTGFLDLGGMLRNPKDITVRVAVLLKSNPERDPDAFFTELFGSYYKKQMKASRITHRLLRMKRELDTGSDTMERKLRYLLWLN